MVLQEKFEQVDSIVGQMINQRHLSTDSTQRKLTYKH